MKMTTERALFILHQRCKDNTEAKEALEFLKKNITMTEMAEPSRKGHWIVLSSTDMYCSECNEVEELNTKRKYCSWCGADMRGDTDADSN